MSNDNRLRVVAALKRALSDIPESAAAIDHAEEKPGWQTTTFVLLGATGVIAYFTWLVSTSFFLGVNGYLLDGSMGIAWRLVPFYAGVFVLLAATWQWSDQFSGRKGASFLALWAIIACPLCSVSVLVDAGSGLVAVFCFASGTGTGGLLLLAGRFVASLRHTTVMVMLPLSVAAAALVTLGIMFMQSSVVQTVIGILLSTTSAICSMSVMAIYLAKHVGRVRQVDSVARNVMDWRSVGAVMAHSMCIGFAAYGTFFLGARGSEATMVVVLLLAFLSAVLFVCSVAFGLGLMASEALQLRFLVPEAAVGVISMSFMHDVGMTLGCAALSLFFVPQVITNFAAVAEGVRISRLCPIRTFSGSYVANFAGLALGVLLGYWAFGYNEVPDPVNSLAVGFVLLFAITLLQSLMFRDRYPSRESEISSGGALNAPYAEDGGLAAAKPEEALPQAGGASVMAVLGEDASAGAGSLKEPCGSDGPCEVPNPECFEHAEGRLSWTERCDVVADSIGLSARQREVLVLLSRGYSTKYIEDKLFISDHTAKSHIHSIYQKAGVHSKQEIIEMVESVPDMRA